MKLAHYSTVAENQKIDRSAGVIFGVSVITLGRAQGHNMQIDGDTLAQMLAVASSHKERNDPDWLHCHRRRGAIGGSDGGCLVVYTHLLQRETTQLKGDAKWANQRRLAHQ